MLPREVTAVLRHYIKITAYSKTDHYLFFKFNFEGEYVAVSFILAQILLYIFNGDIIRSIQRRIMLLCSYLLKVIKRLHLAP